MNDDRGGAPTGAEYAGIGEGGGLPRHVAMIMDGNGRWARRRHLPRFAGHKAGVETVRTVVRECAERGVTALTLFAFSSENWRRPSDEVELLMGLFSTALRHEVKRLHKNGIRLRVIGDRDAFGSALVSQIERAEKLTRDNTRMQLVIAANYGGRWDITEAARALARRVEAGELRADAITSPMLAAHLSLSDLPEPDLFVRTGGEMRVSNFLLWQLAYTEYYFTDVLWPDFDRDALEAAFASYAARERRFGRTGEQLEPAAAGD